MIGRSPGVAKLVVIDQDFDEWISVIAEPEDHAARFTRVDPHIAVAGITSRAVGEDTHKLVVLNDHPAVHFVGERD